jgi:type II secretion system protein C
MALAIPSFSSDSINLQRFLRRNAVTQAVLVGKIALLALAALLLSKLAYDIYSVRALAQKELDAFNARLSSSAPSPTPKRAKGPHNYGVIAERAIFGPLGQAAVKAPPASTKTTKNTAFALIGTFVGTGQEEFAIIEEQKKKSQEVFLLNDSVFGEAQLIGIFPDRVELRRNGMVEVLTLDSTPDASTPIEGGVAQVDADEYAVDEAELDKALENLPLLLTQARAVPFFKEGRAVGLRLFAIRAGSLFEKIGLQNGDVLKSVNGNSLADLSQAMQLFQKLKEERSISVILERNSVERKFNYEIR